MEIIKKSLDIDFGSENIRFYLSQISTDLDEAKKRIINPAQKWQVIRRILEEVSNIDNGKPFNFLILPEIAVPYTHALELVDFVRNSFPDNTITIFGIELITVEEGRTLASHLHIHDKEVASVFHPNDKDRLVNPCIVIIKGKGGGCEYFLQCKISPSKYQGALDYVENLLSSNYLYYFQFSNLSFITLTCSDFFNRPAGSFSKIIDEIDYQILKKGFPLDFIFNIQYNPSPDHPLFLHSLNKIYDDGYRHQGHLCTIFLNSIINGNRKGGLSKVLFYKNWKLPEKQPLKQIDAPVVGYELSDNDTLIYLCFDRLPKSWDRSRDISPLHLEYLQLNGEGWVPQRDIPIRYLAPIEKEASLDYDTYEELARRLSELGSFEKSINWAERALRYWQREKNYYKAAETASFIARQHRHQGEFNDSLRLYADAESLILRVENITPKSALTRWRILLGRVMVEDFMIKGNCKKACKIYEDYCREMDEYMKTSMTPTDPLREEIELYRIHLIRQQAEMFRMLGSYDKARKLFRSASKKYSYVYAMEKAYSNLGQGDCLRMLGEYEEALKKYDEAAEFVKVKNDKRLMARILRNKAEIYRLNMTSEAVIDLIEKLSCLSNDINYLYGHFYSYLTMGGLHLTIDIAKAITSFEQIKLRLPQINKNYLRVEYAHYLFGMAEAYRLSGDPKAIEFFDEAHRLYKDTGISWGIIRTSIGLNLLGSDHYKSSKVVQGFHITDRIELDLIQRFTQGHINKADTLFLNVP